MTVTVGRWTDEEFSTLVSLFSALYEHDNDARNLALSALADFFEEHGKSWESYLTRKLVSVDGKVLLRAMSITRDGPSWTGSGEVSLGLVDISGFAPVDHNLKLSWKPDNDYGFSLDSHPWR